MKTIMSTVLFLAFSTLHAQVPTSAVTRSTDSLSIEVLAKALGDLAVETNKIGEQEAVTKAAEYTYKAQKTSWLDNFRASGNINSFSNNRTNSDALTGQAFYPRYNLGVSVGLGIFVNYPKQLKAGYYRYQVEVESLKSAKENLRNEVISRYYNYVRTQKLFQLQENVLQDTEFATKKTEERFSKGEVNLDVYTAATKRFISEQVEKISLERDLMVGKLQLESLLEMPLEVALSKARSAQRNGIGVRK